MDEHGLTPTQRRALESLMATGVPRPTFPPDVADRLRAALEADLAVVAEQVGEAGTTVTKRDLAQVLACEAHHVAEQQRDFAWSSRTSQGAVAHKAIELSVNLRPCPVPAELVDLAVERLIEDGADWGPARFLQQASPVERAELRAYAIDVVHKFQDEFPPLKPRWRPRVESALAAVLCGGRISLRGKVDLALGQAQGTVAHVMIVDFKTGQPAAGHLDDLRYYALLETLRSGVPPFRVASWYLDSGHWHAEDVDEDLLETALRRTVDGVVKLVELRAGARPPAVRPGPSCGFCAARTTCDGAVAWQARRDG